MEGAHNDHRADRESGDDDDVAIGVIRERQRVVLHSRRTAEIAHDHHRRRRARWALRVRRRVRHRVFRRGNPIANRASDARACEANGREFELDRHIF